MTDVKRDAQHTRATRDQKREPRLPHEHDESSDAQRTPQPPNDEAGKQAHSDVKRGLVDTDEGLRAHAVQSPKRRRPV